MGSGTDFPISVIGGKLNLISDTTVVANGGGIVTFTPSFISTTLRTSNTTTQYNFQTTGHFAPVASGTNSFIEVHVHPIVNQTGGHTGITRGVYIDPTLTNAADFRGIEINTPGQTALKIVSGLIQFNLGTDSTGDIYYRNSLGNLDRLEIGTSSQVLIGGAIPA